MREEIANWIFDGQGDHSFCLLSISAKFREESALYRSFAVEALLPESKVNWSLPAGVLSDGEILCSIKVCECSLYALAEEWEERFAALCVSVSVPLRETTLKDAGKVPPANRRQVLSFPGRALCARLCVYRL